jgi:CrcB protein
MVDLIIFWWEAYQMLLQFLRSLKPIFEKILLVIIGGGLGALTRYGVGIFAGKFIGTRFPYGTLIVNLAGCFLIGVCFALVEKTSWPGPSARLFLMTGFLGALTTFSTYALETFVSIRSGTFSAAALNFLLNNVLGLCLVIAGIWFVKIIITPNP